MDRIEALKAQIKSLNKEKLDLKKEYDILRKEKELNDQITNLEQQKLYLEALISELLEECREEEGYITEIEFETNNNTVSRKIVDARIKDIKSNISQLKNQVALIEQELVKLIDEVSKNKVKLSKLYGKRLTETSEIEKILGNE